MYIQYIWQGNHRTYGPLRCIYIRIWLTLFGTRSLSKLTLIVDISLLVFPLQMRLHVHPFRVLILCPLFIHPNAFASSPCTLYGQVSQAMGPYLRATPGGMATGPLATVGATTHPMDVVSLVWHTTNLFCLGCAVRHRSKWNNMQQPSNT